MTYSSAPRKSISFEPLWIPARAGKRRRTVQDPTAGQSDIHLGVSWIQCSYDRLEPLPFRGLDNHGHSRDRIGGAAARMVGARVDSYHGHGCFRVPDLLRPRLPTQAHSDRIRRAAALPIAHRGQSTANRATAPGHLNQPTDGPKLCAETNLPYAEFRNGTRLRRPSRQRGPRSRNRSSIDHCLHC